jgi:hypothetical protein
MTQKMFAHFFSMKTLILAAFAALSLGLGVASSQSLARGTPQQGGEAYNFVGGGGG